MKYSGQELAGEIKRFNKIIAKVMENQYSDTSIQKKTNATEITYTVFIRDDRQNHIRLVTNERKTEFLERAIINKRFLRHSTHPRKVHGRNFSLHG